MRASLGTGIRPPDAFEIAFTDNPALRTRTQPQRGHRRQPRRAAAADGWRPRVFFNRYDDLIVAVGGSFAGASRYRTDNISNARARGLELERAWRGPHGVHARAAPTR